MKVLREGMGVPIAMSRFGCRVLADEGAEPLYVPHGVDTGIYWPGDPHAYRDTLPGVTDDTFVIGLCAMNRDPFQEGTPGAVPGVREFSPPSPGQFPGRPQQSGRGAEPDRDGGPAGHHRCRGLPGSLQLRLGLITE